MLFQLYPNEKKAEIPNGWTKQVSLIVTLIQTSISEQGLNVLSTDIKGTESTHENKDIKLNKNYSRQEDQA